MPPPLAFTYTPKVRLREIIIDTGISLPSDQATNPPILHFNGLWDTGASNCVITTDAVAKLGLKPFALANVTHGGGTELKNVYKINIYLPNQVTIANVNATEGMVNGKFDFIIGMDIITLGDFSISNFNNETVVSFRIPSQKKIDYVVEAQETIHTPIKVSKVPGLNDPCHCGSGRKYKNCHAFKKN
jgi:hypothetical protein